MQLKYVKVRHKKSLPRFPPGCPRLFDTAMWVPCIAVRQAMQIKSDLVGSPATSHSTDSDRCRWSLSSAPASPPTYTQRLNADTLENSGKPQYSCMVPTPLYIAALLIPPSEWETFMMLGHGKAAAFLQSPLALIRPLTEHQTFHINQGKAT